MLVRKIFCSNVNAKFSKFSTFILISDNYLVTSVISSYILPILACMYSCYSSSYKKISKSVYLRRFIG